MDDSRVRRPPIHMASVILGMAQMVVGRPGIKPDSGSQNEENHR